VVRPPDSSRKEVARAAGSRWLAASLFAAGKVPARIVYPLPFACPGVREFFKALRKNMRRSPVMSRRIDGTNVRDGVPSQKGMKMYVVF